MKGKAGQRFLAGQAHGFVDVCGLFEVYLASLWHPDATSFKAHIIREVQACEGQ